MRNRLFPGADSGPAPLPGESRTVPLRQPTIVWVGQTGGRWSTPINWSGRRVPGPDDHVYIGPLPAGTPVTITGGNVQIASLVSDHDLVLGAGVLDVATTSTISATFTMNGGTLTGAGDFVVTGALAWRGGLMTGPARTLATGSVTLGGQIAGTSYLDGGRVFENRGSAVWVNGHIRLKYGSGRGAGRLINAAGATFEIRARYEMDAGREGEPGDGSDALFQNLGTVILSPAANATISAPFDNQGMLDIAAGRLNLEGRGMLGGTIDVAAEAMLFFGVCAYLAQGPSFRTCPGSIVVGPGAIVDLAGPLAITGPLELRNGKLNTSSAISAARYHQNGGTLSGSGDLHVSDELVWLGGEMIGPGRTVSSDEMVLLRSPGVIYLDGGRILENRGAAVWNPGFISLHYRDVRGPGRLVNAAGATFDIRSSQYAITTSNGGTGDDASGALFENFGTVTLNAEPGPVAIAVRFENSGTLDIGRGHLWLSGGGIIAGAIDVASGASLRMNSGRYRVEGSSLRASPGIIGVGGGSVELTSPLATPGTIELTTGTIHADNAIAAAVYRQSGGSLTGVGELNASAELALSGGLMAGMARTVSSGLLTLSQGAAGGVTLDAGRILENRGSATVDVSHIDLNGGFGQGAGRLVNEAGAVMEILAATVIASAHGEDDNGTHALFENRGTIITSNAYQVAIHCRFHSAGAIQVAAGALSLHGGGRLDGPVEAAAGASLVFASGSYQVWGPEFSGFQGTIKVDGASVQVNAALAPAGLLELSAGELTSGAGIQVASYRQSGGTLNGGDLHASGELAWLGGTMAGMGSTVSSGTLTLLGPVVGAGIGLDGGRVLENRGTANWNNGYLDLNAGTEPGSGRLVNAEGATMVIAASSYRIFAGKQAGADDGGDALFENFGTLVFQTAYAGNIAVPFANHGLLDIRRAVLHVHATGVNTGVVDVGSSGGFRIDGDFNNIGDLRFRIAGQEEYGRMQVGGTATLAGRIGIEADGYQPADGLAIRVLGFGARVGMFDAVDPESPAEGLAYEIDYSEPTHIIVRVVSGDT